MQEVEQEQLKPEQREGYCIACEAEKIGAEVPEECVCKLTS